MPCPEIVAPIAVPDIELIADDGEEHGMGTIKKVPVLDGVETDIGRKLWRSSPVPARAVKVFRLGHRRERSAYLLCSGT